MDKHELAARVAGSYGRATATSTKYDRREPEMEWELESGGDEDESCAKSRKNTKHHRDEDKRGGGWIFPLTTLKVF
jgi:hypothetical protein